MIKQGNTNEGITLIDDVAQNHPITGDILDILQEAYVLLNQFAKLNKVMELVARRLPNNEPFLRQMWFESMLHFNYYPGIQKSTMALHRLGKREYTLWAAFGLYQCVISGDATKQEMMLFPMLGLKLLDGAKPMKNAQEAYLYTILLQSANKKKELAEYVTSKEVKDWDLLDINVLIPKALEDVQDWEKLVTHCTEYLVDKKRDDWNHWKALLNAYKQLGKDEEAIAFLNGYGKTQNSMLGRVEVAYIGIKGAESLNSAVEHYFDFMGKKRATFSDLVNYLSTEKLDKSKWMEYLSKVEQKDLVVKSNVEKFKFMLRADNFDVNKTVNEQIKHFEAYKVELKAKEVKDYHPGDDFILIAVCAILEVSNDRAALLKAASLLELVAQHDKHQFYVRLWLVRIYLLLGAPGIAKSHYKILRITRIQNESLAHLYVTRITTLLPDYEGLKEAYEFYEYGPSEVSSYLLETFRNNVFTQMESINDFQRTLKSSVTRGILITELQKLKKFEETPKLAELGNLDLESMKDNRNFEIMFDLPRPNDQRISNTKRLSIGPKMGKLWIELYQDRQVLLTKLNKSSTTELAAAAEKFEASMKASVLEITEQEAWSARVLVKLSCSALKKQDASSYASVIDELLNHQHLLDAIESLPITWVTLHTLFTIVEQAKIITTYTAQLQKLKSIIPFAASEANQLASVATKMFSQALDVAKKLKSSRPETEKSDTEMLIEWTKTVGFTDSIFVNGIRAAAETVAESVSVEADRVLTYLRALKL